MTFKLGSFPVATCDPEKRLASQRRYREKKKIAKYGPEAAGRNMSGRHGKHARGPRNGRFNHGVLRSSQGYVLVRVAKSHHRAFGPPGLVGAYAYEHDLIAEKMIGRPLTKEETVHHRNGVRDDNREENLEVKTRSDHATEHALFPGARDEMGRFAPDSPRSGSLTDQAVPEVTL